MRAILVTGKGGVGKTTVTAAIARAISATGKRVLAGEVAAVGDSVSPLGLALGVSNAGLSPVPVAEGLDMVLLDSASGHRAFLRDVLPLRMLADAAMSSEAIRRFLSTAPAFPEMGTLYRMLELMRLRGKGQAYAYDTLVIDLPATGHALALAQIPGALLEILPGGPIVDAVKEGLVTLHDPEKTGAIVVTLPEALPVSESLELLDGIVKHGIAARGIVLNRVPTNPFSAAELHAVAAHFESAPSLLGSRHTGRIVRANEARARLVGHGAPLLELPELPFDDHDPASHPSLLAPHFSPRSNP